MSRINDESYVTLATNDNYVIGALTLAQSLRNSNTNRSLTVLITNGVSFALQQRLRELFDHIEVVDILDSNDSVNLGLLKRPELGITFTKLHCWRLIQFKKCVFIDADCLALKNVDDLFERDEFSAAADVGWPDCFNSGVFVYRPSLNTYLQLLDFALTHGSFDGGDQGLLNSYFNSWSTSESSRRLPFVYNMTTNVSYSYVPAYKQFQDTIKIVHFIGANKPWYLRYNADNNTIVGNVNQNELTHLTQWWSVFTSSVLTRLDDETRTRINQQIIRTNQSNQHHPQQFHHQQQSFAPQSSVESSNTNVEQQQQQQQASNVYATGSVTHDGVVIGSDQHKNLWEKGQIEYTGRDSFSNIQAHLDTQLNK